MNDIPVARRFFLGAMALFLTSLLVRPQMSSALVVRGDELAMRANEQRALVMYRRAVWLDPNNPVALDRVAFTAMMTHDAPSIRAAIDRSTEYLRSSPNDRTVLSDRAMCERAVGMQEASERDFLVLGRRDRDPQAYTFAGFAALRQGAPARAKRWWRRALAIAPSYFPALHALARRS